MILLYLIPLAPFAPLPTVYPTTTGYKYSLDIHSKQLSLLTSTVYRLSIHGLWPSNNRPVPLSCCVGSLPLVPSIVDDPNWSELLLGMEEDWLDVTAEADGDCSTCYLWNHEWQKHGR